MKFINDHISISCSIIVMEFLALLKYGNKRKEMQMKVYLFTSVFFNNSNIIYIMSKSSRAMSKNQISGSS